ncbi:FAD-dependent monooxygenase [Streptomyces yunnanensis]|uniref:2-polyprenyl-6-methoxyphenol hydroxylase n=1 Tax=Streptomyces yunnanensis TaxID=156453 RepID=A0A9X8QNY2_9ACTN|nr:FAD-dependent monooxygenase [Streptomyces yunnanensis]SHL01624.1 2-polyprenyl-6-methoxyphenol hydroxylase [Streptomyces yunnanensis]
MPASPDTAAQLRTSGAARARRTVLISGAGVAGPALAHWLHRYGFTVTVVERAPQLRAGGYKVDIRGAAIDVVERMGLLEDIRRLSTDMRTGAYVDGDGKRIATLPAEIFGGRTGRDDEVMRGDLARLLYARTRSDVEYVFGDSITSMTSTPITAPAGDDRGDGTSGVEVAFERGAPRRFDLVVGADGLHSTVRRLAFGPEERYLRHLGAYISAFSVPNALGLDREELYHALPGKLTCVYRSAGDPTAKGMLAFRSPRLAYDHRDTGHQRALLERAFAGDGWQIPRLLEAAPEVDDFYFDGMQLIEMDHWSRGRVVLLGDAAHCASPASGQGTGMALVGAYVLAGELAAADGDPTAAFARYEAEMRGYVAANHALAEKFAREMTVTSRWQIRLRMLMLRMLPYMPWKDAVAKKIAEEVQRAAQAITLKDYPAPAAHGATARPAAASGPRPGPRAYAA